MASEDNSVLEEVSVEKIKSAEFAGKYKGINKKTLTVANFEPIVALHCILDKDNAVMKIVVEVD